MRSKFLTEVLLISLILFSCTTATPKAEERDAPRKEGNQKSVSAADSEFQRKIKLGHGFEILVGGEEDFERFKTYTMFKLYRNGSEIYQDSSLTEYEFGDKLYPLYLPVGNDGFEIMVEINDRPNKNYLKHFRVNGKKLSKIEKLPTFITHGKNLDSDGYLEFAGFWDYPQISTDNNGNGITAYNPILYYQLTKNGLEMDSTLTIERNTKIYGKFSGFEFNETVEVLTRTAVNHAKEVERIKDTE